VAKVWLGPGEGNIIINRQEINQYLKRKDLVDLALRPLVATDSLTRYNIKVSVRGGGSAGQAAAISLAVARALAKLDSDLHKPLKDAGLLTRDPREKERMKYGLAKRRKSFQWTKR
jgi:small subunit ribosomal protein S9